MLEGVHFKPGVKFNETVQSCRLSNELGPTVRVFFCHTGEKLLPRYNLLKHILNKCDKIAC